MKKKLSLAVLIGILVSLAVAVSVSAERKYDLPVNMSSTYVQAQVDVFNIEDVKNLYSTYGIYKNRIFFELQGTDTKYLLFCYNASGQYIDTVYFNYGDKYVDVLDTTAMIELALPSRNESSDTLVVNSMMKVYADDGRTKDIFTLQLPVYELVGWHRPVMLYSDDDRVLPVAPSQVAAYNNVGWYLYEDYVYRKVQKTYQVCKSVYDYWGMMRLADMYMPYLKGTKHENSLYAIRTEGMDLWRKSANAPVTCADISLKDGNTVALNFINVSYKNVKAIEMKLVCYDSNGNVIQPEYGYYTYDEKVLTPATYAVASAQLGASGVHTLDKVRVTRVVFDDGSEWKE